MGSMHRNLPPLSSSTKVFLANQFLKYNTPESQKAEKKQKHDKKSKRK
jgi:hypothetical protein